MNVIRVKANGIDLVLQAKYFKSLLEWAKTHKAKLIKGQIPESQIKTCVRFDDFVGILNGNKGFISKFTFKSGWLAPKIEPDMNFNNSVERVASIKKYVKELLLAGITVDVLSVSRVYDLTPQTIRKHVVSVLADLTKEDLIVTRKGTKYVPLRGE